MTRRRGPSAPRRLAAWAIALAVAGVLAVPPLSAAPALFPAAQIAPGMTGVGKTVVLGTKIAEFGVRILGVLRNAGPAGDLVLFRASGPVIQEYGGLAAGMSGSPIYLGGRLAGAFSYSFQAADPSVGLFTPIEDMLKALPPRAGAEGAHGRITAIAPLRLRGRTFRRVALAPAAPTPPDTLVAVPAATPLFVSGLGVTAQAALGTVLQPFGLVPMQGSAMVPLPASLPLEPGSAIGVALMQGDIAVYAIGTMTYRDGDRILGFGHPFTDVGGASYLLTNATILQTLHGLERNLKVGAAGTVVGTISEDRPAAIGGTVGRLPRVFGVHVKVTDTDSGASRQFSFQVVSSKLLAPDLVTLGAQAAVERALNRSGEGTAQVRMVLRGRALPHPIVRENIFYNGSDIAARALSEVPQALHLAFDNDFSEVGPTDLEIDVGITGQRQTATITDVTVPKGPITPGGTLRVAVTIRPFRGSPVTENVELAVPSELPAGPAMLVVRAGGVGPQPAPVPGAAPTAHGLAVPQTLTDAIAAFEAGEKNTDLVVELVGGPRRPAEAGSLPPRGLTRASATRTMPWVLRGRLEGPVMIGGGAR